MPADVPAPAPVPAGPPLPPPRRSPGPYRVCLVCLGNICRSPMADVVLRAELDRAGLAGLVEVDSAGTGDWHLGEPMAGQAAAELARRGYDGSAHRARRIQRSWFGQRDLVLAMDRSNLASLRALAPDAEAAGPRLMLFRSFDPDLAGGAPAIPGTARCPTPTGGRRPATRKPWTWCRVRCGAWWAAGPAAGRRGGPPGEVAADAPGGPAGA